MDNCNCPCKGSFFKVCNAVPQCSDLQIFVGRTESGNSFIFEIENKGTKECKVIKVTADNFGFVKLETKDFWYKGWALRYQYSISAKRFNGEPFCLPHFCNSYGRLDFVMKPCENKDIHLLNEICGETPNINCIIPISTLQNCTILLKDDCIFLRNCTITLDKNMIELIEICGQTYQINEFPLIYDSATNLWVINPVLQTKLNAFAPTTILTVQQDSNFNAELVVQAQCKVRVKQTGAWKDCATVNYAGRIATATFEQNRQPNFPESACSLKICYASACSPCNPNPINNKSELIDWFNTQGWGVFGFDSITNEYLVPLTPDADLNWYLS